MDEIVLEFLVESRENVSQIELDLVALEEHPENTEILRNVFRAFHSIKGSCGFVNFSQLESIAHGSENLLDKLRGGELRIQQDITSALLSVLDAMREILDCIERTGAEGDADYTALNDRLTQLCEGESGAAVNLATASSEEAHLNTEAEVPSSAMDSGSFADSTIRVRVAVLDHLVDLVGELVLARNQVLECSERFRDAELMATSQRLGLVSTELQVGVMQTRMQPIATIWNSFPRVVRDLSLSCGKRVRLDTMGEDTEVDRALIEALRDPLTHVVRNCIDHGIETPDLRVSAGKPSEGCITLSAFHEGGLVNIEIRDDGAGIDLERVRSKAVELGIVSSEQARQLADRDAIALVLTAGFSTAEETTSLSGRGVGMDVVKTNIERIGGTVDVVSAAGKGTSVTIKVPLTLAIIPALIITTGGQRFALPQVNLRELVRLEGNAASRGIEDVHGAPVYRLRGKLLPIVYLRDQIHLGAADNRGQTVAHDTSRAAMQPTEILNIVVLQADDRTFGLVVDKINDTQEIVVKPLGKHLMNLDCYAGATIMGDGAVALILDAVGLARRAQEASSTDKTTFAVEETAAEEARRQVQSMVVFRNSDGGRMAIPSDRVSRLEELDRSAVERVGRHEVVQYRGDIMRLIHLASSLNAQGVEKPAVTNPAGEDDKIQVVILLTKGKTIGLVVDRILDIVDEEVTIQRSETREGVLGIAVLGGLVTELLAVDSLIREADQSFSKVEEAVVEFA